MIKAIIFDYDGLLVDTDGLWFEASKELCREYGVVVHESDRSDLMRGSLSQYLINKYKLPVTQEVTRPKLNAIFDRLTKGEIIALPGAIDLVKHLSKKFPLAAASGTRKERLSASLKTLGIFDCFNVIIGNDEVKYGKPSPEIYIKAANELKVSPKDCLVFEDQPKGLAAAKGANMYCIVIPNKNLKNIDYSQADKIFKSLELVNDKAINLLGTNTHK